METKKIKILHFEDDDIIAEMYHTKFNHEGFDVIHLKDPAPNPVETVAKEKPDLILMDVVMPKMDGVEATILLKKDSRTMNIPVYGLSNYNQPKDIERGLSAGMKEYWITAEQTPEEVVKKIKNIFYPSV